MEKKRYEIIETVEHIKKKEDIEVGCSLNVVDPTILEEFEILEDAQEALKKHKTEVRKFQGVLGYLWEVTEYHIEEVVSTADEYGYYNDKYCYVQDITELPEEF